MQLKDYLKLLPMKSNYQLSLVKRNKKIQLHFYNHTSDSQHRLKYVSKKDMKAGSGLVHTANLNNGDFRNNSTILLQRANTSINEHDGIKLIFEYEDW